MALLNSDYLYIQTGSIPKKSTVGELINLFPINNTLTSTSTTEALSAAQGKVLKDSVSFNFIQGTT